MCKWRERTRQQMAFSCGCATANWLVYFKETANHNPWFVFLCLMPHFMLRHFLAKCSFHSSVRSQQSCQSGRLMKTGPSTSRRKIQKLIQQTFREEYPTNITVLWNLDQGYTIIQWCNVCCFESKINYVCMYDIHGRMFCSLFRTCALHLKSSYYT